MDRSRQRHTGEFVVKVPQVMIVVDGLRVGRGQLLLFQFRPVNLFEKGLLLQSRHPSDFKHG